MIFRLHQLAPTTVGREWSKLKLNEKNEDDEEGTQKNDSYDLPFE